MSQRKVFVANRGYHNYSAAERYGVLVPVTEYKVNIKSTDTLIGQIHEVLSHASSDDYLLVSGPAIVNVLCVGAWLARFGSVNLIFYDTLDGDYISREGLDFEQDEEVNWHKPWEEVK